MPIRLDASACGGHVRCPLSLPARSFQRQSRRDARRRSIGLPPRRLTVRAVARRGGFLLSGGRFRTICLHTLMQDRARLRIVRAPTGRVPRFAFGGSAPMEPIAGLEVGSSAAPSARLIRSPRHGSSPPLPSPGRGVRCCCSRAVRVALRRPVREHQSADSQLQRQPGPRHHAPTRTGLRGGDAELVRDGIQNFFINLRYPVVPLNQLLQGKLGLAASTRAGFW